MTGLKWRRRLVSFLALAILLALVVPAASAQGITKTFVYRDKVEVIATGEQGVVVGYDWIRSREGYPLRIDSSRVLVQLDAVTSKYYNATELERIMPATPVPDRYYPRRGGGAFMPRCSEGDCY